MIRLPMKSPFWELVPLHRFVVHQSHYQLDTYLHAVDITVVIRLPYVPLLARLQRPIIAPFRAALKLPPHGSTLIIPSLSACYIDMPVYHRFSLGEVGVIWFTYLMIYLHQVDSLSEGLS